MKVLVQVGTALAVVVLAAAGAAAATTKYGSEAGWDIYVDSAMGPGCLITKDLPNGEQLQMGIDVSTANKRGYIALYTKAGANVGAGEQISVLFDIDGQQFSGEAKGQKIEGFTGAYVRANNPEFIYDLVKKHTLTMTPQGRDPIVVSLDGTNNAFKALRTCQDAQ